MLVSCCPGTCQRSGSVTNLCLIHGVVLLLQGLGVARSSSTVPRSGCDLSTSQEASLVISWHSEASNTSSTHIGVQESCWSSGVWQTPAGSALPLSSHFVCRYECTCKHTSASHLQPLCGFFGTDRTIGCLLQLKAQVQQPQLLAPDCALCALLGHL